MRVTAKNTPIRKSGPESRRCARRTPAAASRRPEHWLQLQRRIGNRAARRLAARSGRAGRRVSSKVADVVMRKIGFEYEVGGIATQKTKAPWPLAYEWTWGAHGKGESLLSRNGYDITADISGSGSQLEFITDPIDENSRTAGTTLEALGKSIRADIDAIIKRDRELKKNWVRLDQIPRLAGKWWHRLSVGAKRDSMFGQLQMTGGVSLDKLARVLSGAALGAEPGPAEQRDRGEVKRELMRNFFQESQVPRNLGPRDPKQLLYRTALAKVKALDALGKDDAAEQLFASVVALMATIPIEKRVGPIKINELTGLLLAKTDYARIMELAARHTGRTLSAQQLLTALLATINTHVDKSVVGSSPVFPISHKVKGTTFTDLTIAAWAKGVVPKKSVLGHFVGGEDLATSAHFPGTKKQKEEMRAFGTFGARTDPANKVILEFRNFTSLHPDDLDNALVAVGQYMKSDVHER